jgi:hypothetical protein
MSSSVATMPMLAKAFFTFGANKTLKPSPSKSHSLEKRRRVSCLSNLSADEEEAIEVEEADEEVNEKACGFLDVSSWRKVESISLRSSPLKVDTRIELAEKVWFFVRVAVELLLKLDLEEGERTELVWLASNFFTESGITVDPVFQAKPRGSSGFCIPNEKEPTEEMKKRSHNTNTKIEKTQLTAIKEQHTLLAALSTPFLSQTESVTGHFLNRFRFIYNNKV